MSGFCKGKFTSAVGEGKEDELQDFSFQTHLCLLFAISSESLGDSAGRCGQKILPLSDVPLALFGSEADRGEGHCSPQEVEVGHF